MFSRLHLVTPSLHAVLMSIAILALSTSFVVWAKISLSFNLIASLMGTALLLGIWMKDVVMEGLAGYHTHYMQDTFRFGFLFFLFSEAMFFASIFWAYFDSALSPAVEVGDTWSPMGIMLINPLGIPLLNTMLLLTSGVCVTWSHHALLSNFNAAPGLLMSFFLGALFEILQGYEYMEASFSISDGIFGSCFYLSTGFHGLHVLAGATFLLVNYVRLISFHFSPTRHLGFEMGALYWHFVDVIWLFLYLFVYFWSL